MPEQQVGGRGEAAGLPVRPSWAEGAVLALTAPAPWGRRLGVDPGQLRLRLLEVVLDEQHAAAAGRVERMEACAVAPSLGL